MTKMMLVDGQMCAASIAAAPFPCRVGNNSRTVGAGCSMRRLNCATCAGTEKRRSIVALDTRHYGSEDEFYLPEKKHLKLFGLLEATTAKSCG